MADEELNTAAVATDPAMLDTQEIASAVSAAADDGPAVVGDAPGAEAASAGSAGDLEGVVQGGGNLVLDPKPEPDSARPEPESILERQAREAVRVQQQAIRDNAGDASIPGTQPAQRPAGPHGVGDSTETEVVPPVVEDGSSLSPEPQAGAARVVDGQIVRG